MRYSNNLKTLVMICMTVILLPACQKYLDEKSNSSLVTPSTVSDLQGLMDDEVTMNKATPSFGESSADDYFWVPSIYDAMPVAYQDWYTWQPYDYTFGNDWSSSAPAIYNCNLSLETLDGIARTTSNATAWDNVEGSALFFRSYYFLGLLWDYAKAYNPATASTDLGIMLRTSSNFNTSFPRVSVEACYDRIINDTKTAITLLPDTAINELRPCKAAVYGLLSRAYLTKMDYSNALLYADSCLAIKSLLMDYNTDPQVKVNANAPFKQFNKETIFYSEMNNMFDLPVEYNGASTDTVLYVSYSSYDLRKIALFMPLGINNYVQYKGSYSGNMDVFFSGITTAEMYLTRAECEVRNGDITDGLNDLNTLLNKRYVTGTFTNIVTDNKDSALNIVLLERRKEMLMRGQSWITVKRRNMEGANIILQRVKGSSAFTLQPNATGYALPFPIDIVRQTGIQQN